MRVSALFVLAMIGFCPCAFSQASAHWTCVDAAAKTVATDTPCPEGSTLLPAGARIKPSLATLDPKPDWRSKGIPVWIWPIVGALGLAWIWFLLPEGLFRKKSAETAPLAPPARLPPVVFVPPPRKPAIPSGRPAMMTVPAGTPPTPAPTPTPHRPSGWTLELINGLSLNRLEALVQRLWQARGCEVERAKGGDGGIQLLVSRPATGKLFALAQCAATRGDKVSLASVKTLLATGMQKSAGISVLYGLTGFTDEALAFVKDQPIKLVTGSTLLAEIGLMAPVEQQRLLERTLLESGPAMARA